MDLTLPKIEHTTPGASAAGAWDKAANAIEGAATKVGQPIAEDARAQIIANQQEATIQATKGLNDALHVIRSNPYVTPEQLKQYFGGSVPEGVDLTEPVPGSATGERQDRKIIPMHEVAPALFDRQASVVTTAATQQIKETFWQKHFQDAVAKDVESTRSEMLNWQRAQRLADAEIRSVAQYEQMMKDGRFDIAEAILNNAQFTMGVQTREKLIAAHPQAVTEAKINNRLGAVQTVEQIDQLTSEIRKRSLGPLDQEKELQYLGKARTMRHEIITQAWTARQHAIEFAWQSEAMKVHAAIAEADKTPGTSPQTYYKVSQIPSTIALPTGETVPFPHEHYMALKHALEADPKRATVWEVYNKIALLPQERLKLLNPILHRGDLADPEYKQVTEWVRAAQEGGRSPLTKEDHENASRYVKDFLNIDPKDKGNDFNLALGRTLQAIYNYKSSPSYDGKPVFYQQIGTIASANFRETGGKAKDQTTGILTAGLTAAGVAVTDERLRVERKAIEDESKLVDDAYHNLWSDKGIILDEKPSDEIRAQVRAWLIIPSRLAAIKDEITKRGGNAEDKATQVKFIINHLRPPESEPYKQQVEADETQRAAREQVSKEAAKQKAEVEAKKAVEAQAEKARIDAMPVWERASYDLEKAAVNERVGYIRYQSSQKHKYDVDPNARPFQIVTSDNNPMVNKAVEQEVETARAEVERDLKIAYDQYRAGFREFIKKVGASDPHYLELANKYYIHDTVAGFSRYVELRKTLQVP